MLLERFRLDERVAIVSGAGRGIGRAITLALAEAGADVVCTARTAAQIEAVAAEAREFGHRALPLPCDANVPENLGEVVDRTVETFGGVDVLVNVAGGTMPSLVMNTTPEELDLAFHFNVTTAFLLSKLCVPHMLGRGGGSVVNISSALSHYVESGFVAYGTAKAAMSHMTRLMAFEFAPRVRFNALAVGSILTEALRPFLESDGLKEKMEALTPMARLGSPEDVALAALYLASPASGWVTGKVFEIDGGTVASNWPLRISAF